MLVTLRARGERDDAKLVTMGSMQQQMGNAIRMRNEDVDGICIPRNTYLSYNATKYAQLFNIAIYREA